MGSFFHQLQQEIADRLAADPFFDGIPCLWQLKKDIASEIDTAMSSIGAGVLVVTPTASVESGNLPGPYYDDIGVVIQCYSDPVTGAELPRAMEIAEKVASLLHHWQPASLSRPLIAEKPTIVPSQTEDPNTDGLDVRFTTAGGTPYLVPQVALPVITEVDDFVTISCDTEGAVLFYRLDGKNPIPRTAFLYTGPLARVPGLRLRVRAWFPGSLTSETASLNVP